MTDPTAYDFFFSYRRTDQVVAERLVQCISEHKNAKTEQNYSVWWDEHSKEYGDSLDRQVEEGIQQSNCLFILISRGGITGYQELEIAYAKQVYRNNPLRFVVAMSPGVDIGLRKHPILIFLQNPILIGEDSSDAGNCERDLVRYLTSTTRQTFERETSVVFGKHGHKLVNRVNPVKEFNQLLRTNVVSKQKHSPQFFFLTGRTDDQMMSLVDRFMYYELPAALDHIGVSSTFRKVYLGNMDAELDDPAMDLNEFNSNIERSTGLQLNGDQRVQEMVQFAGNKGLYFVSIGSVNDYTKDSMASFQKIMQYWQAEQWSFNFPMFFFFLLEGEPQKGISKWFSKQLDAAALRKKFNALEQKGNVHAFDELKAVEKSDVDKWSRIDPKVYENGNLKKWVQDFFKNEKQQSMLLVEVELEQQIQAIRNKQTIR